jgi:hypothetical protein
VDIFLIFFGIKLKNCKNQTTFFKGFWQVFTNFMKFFFFSFFKVYLRFFEGYLWSFLWI